MIVERAPALYLALPVAVSLWGVGMGLLGPWRFGLVGLLTFAGLFALDLSGALGLPPARLRVALERAAWAFLLLGLGFLALAMGLRSLVEGWSLRPSTQVEGVGEVVEVSPSGASSRAFVRLGDAVFSFRTRLVPPREGALIRLSGRSNLPRGPAYPGAYNGALHLALKGAFSELEGPRFEEVGFRALSPWGIRALLREVLLSMELPRLRDYALAVVLGDPPSRLRELHARSGTSHLLAVSGLHVGFASAPFLLLPLPLWFRSALALLASGLYCAVSGLSPSATRAWLFLLVLLLGRALGRPFDALNALLFVFWASVVLKPSLFWSLGFRLSVLAAVGLILFAGLPGGRGGRWGVLRSLLLAQVGAFWSTYPLVSFSFGSVPLVGLLVNLPVVSLFGLIFAPLVVLSLAVSAWPSLSILALPLEGVLTAMDGALGLLGGLSPYGLPFSLPLSALCASSLALLLFRRASGRPFPSLLAAGLVGVLVLLQPLVALRGDLTVFSDGVEVAAVRREGWTVRGIGSERILKGLSRLVELRAEGEVLAWEGGRARVEGSRLEVEVGSKSLVLWAFEIPSSGLVLEGGDFLRRPSIWP